MAEKATTRSSLILIMSDNPAWLQSGGGRVTPCVLRTKRTSPIRALMFDDPPPLPFEGKPSA